MWISSEKNLEAGELDISHSHQSDVIQNKSRKLQNNRTHKKNTGKSDIISRIIYIYRYNMNIKSLLIDSSYLPLLSFCCVLATYIFKILLCMWQIRDYKRNKSNYIDRIKKHTLIILDLLCHDFKSRIELFDDELRSLMMQVFASIILFIIILFIHKSLSSLNIINNHFFAIQKIVPFVLIYITIILIDAHNNITNEELVFGVFLSVLLVIAKKYVDNSVRRNIDRVLVCIGVIAIARYFFQLFIVNHSDMKRSLLIDFIENEQSKYTHIDINRLKESFSSLKIEVDKIFVDQSDSSVNAAAYKNFFKKYIIVNEGTLKKISENEILCIIGHEMGHWAGNHIIWQHIINFILCILICIFLRKLYDKLVVSKTQTIASVCILHIAIVIINILKFGNNIIGHQFEYSADKYALNIESVENIASMLYKLSVDSEYQDYDFNYLPSLFFSHPSIYNRIEALYKLQA